MVGAYESAMLGCVRTINSTVGVHMCSVAPLVLVEVRVGDGVEAQHFLLDGTPE